MDEWIKAVPEEKRDKIWEEYKNTEDEEKRIKLIRDYHPEGHLNIEPISKLCEYLKYIRASSTKSTWYRGESQKHKLLIPKIYRNIEDKEINNVLEKEFNYFKEFRRRAISIVPHIEKSDYWSWYFLIQHYGGPTRLLDWTSNPMVALFMALNTNRESTENPIIHLLAPTVLLDYALKDIKGNDVKTAKVLYPGEDKTDLWISNLTNCNYDDIPESPIALLPANSDPRIISQKSCFTLFGKRSNGFVKDGKQIICPCCNSRILFKIIIDGKHKENLRQELAKIGISSETIYPGLEGLTKKLNEEIYAESGK